MTRFTLGDSVRFKSGVRDYDFDVDIGGWQGRVLSIEPDGDAVTVAFDSVTLREMPGDYIERCEEDGLGWSGYGADPDDLEAAKPRDTEADVEAAIDELNKRYAYSYLGEEGRQISAILAGIDPKDDVGGIERWGEYLDQALTFPFDTVVAEWQEKRGPIQQGDRLRVMGINMADDFYGVLADVKLGRKSYVFPLCDLKTADDDSPNHEPLQLYCVWFANR